MDFLGLENGQKFSRITGDVSPSLVLDESAKFLTLIMNMMVSGPRSILLKVICVFCFVFSDGDFTDDSMPPTVGVNFPIYLGLGVYGHGVCLHPLQLPKTPSLQTTTIANSILLELGIRLALL